MTEVRTKNPAPQNGPKPYEPGPATNLAKYGGTFHVLDQSGHFHFTKPLDRKGIVEWRRSLTVGERTDFKGVRRDLLEIIGAPTLVEARALFEDESTQTEQFSTEINRRFAEKYGIEDSDSNIEDQIEEWAFLADSLRDRVQKELRYQPGFVEQSNEVRSANSLSSLFKIVLTSPDPRVRFEAGLKLEGIKFAAIDKKNEKDQMQKKLVAKQIELLKEGKDPSDARPDNQGTFADLQAFMNKYVYKSENAGEKPTILLSTHSSDNYRCLDVTRLPEKQVDYALYRKPKKGTRFTAFKERSFTYRGERIAVYSNERLKDPVAALLKMYRKGSENVEGSVEDRIGVMAVLETQDQIDAFIDMIERGAKEAKLPFSIRGTEDSLSGGNYSAVNPGSSKDFRALKFLASIGNMNVEFLFFDHPAYIDNLYRDGVSHVEKQARMLVETGVAEHFFPREFYRLDHRKQLISVVGEIRKNMRQGVTLN